MTPPIPVPPLFFDPPVPPSSYSGTGPASRGRPRVDTSALGRPGRAGRGASGRVGRVPGRRGRPARGRSGVLRRERNPLVNPPDAVGEVSRNNPVTRRDAASKGLTAGPVLIMLAA